MNRSILLAISAVILASAGLYISSQNVSDSIPDHVHYLFSVWQMEHGKKYSSPSERDFRLGVFFKNYLHITSINLSQSDYKLGLNKFSDMTPEEKKIKLTGLMFRETPRNELRLSTSVNADSLDWRTKGAVNHIQDEGSCGSTYAFAAIDSTEAQWFFKTGNLASLSIQAIVDCSNKYGNFGCGGGLMTNSYKYMKDNGIPLANQYPYKGVNQPCKPFTPLLKVSGYVDVPKNDGDALLEAVNKTVVSVGIDVRDIFQYKSGIYTGQCGTNLDHAMSIVGYGVENFIPFWILRNQWGTTWGENGYMRLVRDVGMGPGRCGINMLASYPQL